MTLLAKSADAAGRQETLVDHTKRVIEMARELCSRLPLLPEDRNSARTELELVAATHDIGKAASGFQKCLLGLQRDWRGRRHELLSAAFAANLGVLSEEAVFAVMTHHKQIPGDGFHASENALEWFDGAPPGWPNMCVEFEDNRELVVAAWREICEFLERPDLLESAHKALRSIPLSDAWLDSSQTNGQARKISFERRKRASLLRGLLIGADHLASAHVQLPPLVDMTECRLPEKLRPFQLAAGRIKGHGILRAPTGSGKTEAALLWAATNQAPNGRFFYVLPNTAAINAMHQRLQSAVKGGDGSVGVLHARAAHYLYSRLQDDYPNDRLAAQHEAAARTRLAREMYYPAKVCTPHQLLALSLHGRGWEHMLTEVPNACMVFDEIHSYDPELAGLTLGTARLFSRLGAKVLFASATLPAFLQTEIEGLFPTTLVEPDPTEEPDRELLEKRRHVIVVREGSLLDTIAAIEADATSGRRALAVCNHVRSSQLVYQSLKRRLGDGVLLLHGRFNFRDRRTKERQLNTESLPRVLVATQVVEVSLDLDFDCGYFEAAPIDALAQRMGRVNRRGCRPPATIVVQTRAINPHPLYPSDLTENTVRHLRTLRGPVTEQDLVRICNAVYGDGYTAELHRKFEERLKHPFFEEFESRLVAGRHEDWVRQVIENADGRAAVLPKNLVTEYRRLEREKLWLEASSLLVETRLGGKWNLVNQKSDPWTIAIPYDFEYGLGGPPER